MITFIIAALVLVGCSSSQDVTKNDLTKIDGIIKKDAFKIEAEWARPLNPGDLSRTGLLPLNSTSANINLQGNYNHFEKVGDSLSIDLPYYGQRQLAGGTYNRDANGITFDGIPESSVYSYDKKKSAHIYEFDADNGSELLEIRLTIYPNLKANIHVNSSHRTTISYSGKIQE